MLGVVELAQAYPSRILLYIGTTVDAFARGAEGAARSSNRFETDLCHFHVPLHFATQSQSPSFQSTMYRSGKHVVAHFITEPTLRWRVIPLVQYAEFIAEYGPETV